jgi:tetratricopeptide (TPR) repeat protein
MIIPVAALALLALVGAIVAALLLRAGATAASPLATRQLEVAAAQQPINQTEQLLFQYQDRVRQAPDDVNSYAVLGNLYLQRARETGDPGYYGKAEAVFAEALKRDPQNIEALIGNGSLALSRHQFKEALALGQQAASINPTIPRIYGVIADAQTELGMYDDAIQTLQKMVDMRPDLSSYSRISYMRELHGDTTGALSAMQAAVDAGGPAAENTQWVRVQLGNLYFNQGDLVEAEHEYQQALYQLPGYVYATAGVARVRVAQGKYDEAVALYKQVIAQIPLPEFVIALGETQEAAGRTADAAKQYALVQAMQQLFKANGVDTDLELALFDADHGQDATGTLALARSAYERRPSVKGADTLAWALFKAGQTAEARQYSSQALRLGTQDALMLYHAGVIAQAQGDHVAARDYLKRALALNPHFSPLFAVRAQQTLAEIGSTATK